MRKKLISFAAALAIAASALTGLTAVTSSAETYDALSDWGTFETYYSDDFDYTDQSDASVINAAADDAWTWSDSSGFTATRGYKIYKKALTMKWERWTQYEIPTGSTADNIAFTYKILAKGSGDQYVEIVDSDNTSIQLLDKSAASLTGSEDEEQVKSNPEQFAKTYTTVIDKTSKKAYTYDSDGSLINTKDYNGNFKAIRFRNTDGSDFNFFIFDFEYKFIGKENILSGSDWNFRNYYSEEFNYADQADATVVNDAITDKSKYGQWTWSDSTGFTSARGYKIYGKALTMKWTRWTQYEIPADTATDVIAFKYNVAMKGTTQYVSIIDRGNNEVTILSKEDAASATDFLTVIDTTRKKIYTFKADGTVDTSKSYTGDAVKAIRFGNTSNEDNFNYDVYNFAYKVETGTNTFVGSYGDTDADKAYAYATEFKLDSAKTYTNPTVEWKIVNDSDVGTVTKKFDTSTVKETSSAKYGLVLYGSNDDFGTWNPTVTSTFMAESIAVEDSSSTPGE